MKKSISVLLAVLFALAAVFACSAIAFADDPPEQNNMEANTETRADKPAEDPVADTPKVGAEADKGETRKDTSKDITVPATKETTTVASTDPVKQLEDLINKLDTTTKTTLPNKTEKDDSPVVTNPDGVTAFVDDDTTAGTPTTAKSAAPVKTYVPNTGSSFAVPAFAVLALLAGTVAVVAVKKNED